MWKAMEELDKGKPQVDLRFKNSVEALGGMLQTYNLYIYTCFCQSKSKLIILISSAATKEKCCCLAPSPIGEWRQQQRSNSAVSRIQCH